MTSNIGAIHAVAGSVERNDLCLGEVNSFGIRIEKGQRDQMHREQQLRSEERQKERKRIARELHDTLLQGFIGASLLLHNAMEQTPSDAPSKPSLSHALSVIERVIEEGRARLQGLRSPEDACGSLEELLCALGKELIFGRNVEFRVCVIGRPGVLSSDVQEQIYFIAREAVTNAVRHSGAATIEAELEYSNRRVRLNIRDDGCGMEQNVLRIRRNTQLGILGMCERAESIGAQVRIWSKPGAGTEVEVSAPLKTAMVPS